MSPEPLRLKRPRVRIRTGAPYYVAANYDQRCPHKHRSPEAARKCFHHLAAEGHGPRRVWTGWRP